LSRIRVHIDTDPGLDDLIALGLAFASPELAVEGVTTVAGNAPLDVVTDNALRFLALAGADVPIGRGAAAPLALARVHATHVHGGDGRAGIELPPTRRGELPPARDVLRRSLFERGVTRVLALGPLTNLAALARDEPGAFARAEIVWMGGALGPGNATPTAEFNAWADPAALALLLEASVSLRILPLDCTSQVRLAEHELAECAFGAGAVGRCLEQAMRALMQIERPVLGEPVALLHDPSAIVAAVAPELFCFEARGLEVRVEEGAARGQLRDRAGRPPRVQWAGEAQGARVAQQVVSRLAGWAAGLR
jgi:purine nucleosidase